MSDKKNRILYIQKFLEEQTDEAHPVGIVEILEHLTGLGIETHRRTVMFDIEQLIESGADVVCNKGRKNEYFIGNRHFETPELKLLLDAAQASKFLSVKRSRALVDRLLALTSKYQADNLMNGLYLDKQIKSKNEASYITADLLLTAIDTKRCVQFMYYEYTPDKKKIYKHGRRIYELSPWALVWNNDSYYVIGYSKTHDKAAKFRVDRIATPKLTDIEAIPAPEDFNLASYVKSVFQMYDGEMLDVKLKCENGFMKTIVDRFGEDVQTEIADEGHFYATVSVSASKMFYGWIFALDGAVTIETPAEAVNAYRDMLDRAKSLQ